MASNILLNGVEEIFREIWYTSALDISVFFCISLTEKNINVVILSDKSRVVSILSYHALSSFPNVLNSAYLEFTHLDEGLAYLCSQWPHFL